ncbi:MAG: signal peptidase I [Dehalococcoidia bacterium]
MTSVEALGTAGSGGMRRAAALRWLAKVVGLLAILASVACVGLVLAGVGPTLFGYNAFIMSGASMGSTTPAGSIVVSRPTRAEALAVGDVVTFRRPDQPNTSITHRIVAINHEDGRRVFLTRGDANKDIDPEPARLQGQVDRMVYAVPFAGYIIRFARSRQGVILLLLLPVLGLLALEALSLRRRRRALAPAPTPNPNVAFADEVSALTEEVRQLHEAVVEIRSRLGGEPDAAAPPGEPAPRGRRSADRTVDGAQLPSQRHSSEPLGGRPGDVPMWLNGSSDGENA